MRLAPLDLPITMSMIAPCKYKPTPPYDDEPLQRKRFSLIISSPINIFSVKFSSSCPLA